MNNKIRRSVVATSVLVSLIPTTTYAMCPVCTVAVAGGVGLARYLKIDDLITGLWIGAFIVSLTKWTINYLDKKKIRFFGRKPLLLILYILLVIYPLYHYNLMGHPANQIFGVDRLAASMVIGAAVFYLADIWYQIIKRSNNNHAKYKFQNIVMPVGSLLLTSIIFYFIIKYF